MSTRMGRGEACEPVRPIQHPGPVPDRIRAGLPDLHPSEKRVAQVFLSRPEWTIEASAQDVADAAETSRATVVRTSQRLGFTGYPQLRVLLARDVGPTYATVSDSGSGAGASASASASGASASAPGVDGSRLDGSVADQGDYDRSPHDGPPIGAGPEDSAGLIREYLLEVGAGIGPLSGSLRNEDLTRAVDLLHRARTVLVMGSGLSEPVALEAAMRFNAIGVVADAPTDRVIRGSRARALADVDVCLALSGSGSTSDTVQPARAAAAVGTPVIAITTVPDSPLADTADVVLLSSMGSGSSVGTGTFRDTITRTPRLGQNIIINAIVHALIARDTERARAAQDRMLEVIGDALTQDPH